MGANLKRCADNRIPAVVSKSASKMRAIRGAPRRPLRSRLMADRHCDTICFDPRRVSIERLPECVAAHWIRGWDGADAHGVRLYRGRAGGNRRLLQLLGLAEAGQIALVDAAGHCVADPVRLA